MAKDHKDKVAVVTGAANGIGRAFAQRLAEDGVHIAVVDVVDGDETVKLVESCSRQAIAVKCDVSSEQSVANMAGQVHAKFSHVDIVVNCAGIFPQKEFGDMTFGDWRKVLSINSTAPSWSPPHSCPACGCANGAVWSTWPRARSARWLLALRIMLPVRVASSVSPARWQAILPRTASL